MPGLKYNPKKQDDVYRILISVPNWLGDVIFTTPAIRAIRKRFPNAYISCWMVPRTREVLANNPNVDEIIMFDERGWYRDIPGFLRFFFSIYNRFFDLGILFHRSFTRALIMRMANIPIVVGERTGKRSTFRVLTNPVDVDKDNMHRVDYYLKIIKELGIEADGYQYDFYFTKDDERYVDSLLDYLKVFKNFAVLNIGGNWDYKRWPLENFARLADRIVSELGWDVLLSGSLKDIWSCQQLVDMASYKDRIFIVAGKTSLSQLAVLFKRARVVVSNDSGPLHIAAAVTSNVIGIFGPTSPWITGLTGELSTNNIWLAEGCGVPCYVSECNRDLYCMRAVSPQTVFDKIISVTHQ